MARIVEIQSLSDPVLDICVLLMEAQLKSRLNPTQALFIAESPVVIGYALDAGYAPVSLLMERKHFAGKAAAMIERCAEDIPVYTADESVLTGLTGYPLTRSVLCAMRRPAPRYAAEICGDARRVAVLEGIVDTTSVGAIFRSAAALGMDAGLLSPTYCAPMNRRAVRVSMGTIFQVPWVRLKSWPEEGLRRLNALGFKTSIMTLTDDSVSIDDPALAAEPRLAIVLGTEGNGLAAATLDRCDYTVKIPMAYGVDSLNVTAASAVAFW